MNPKLAFCLLFALLQVGQLSGKPFNFQSAPQWGFVHAGNYVPSVNSTSITQCGLNAVYNYGCSGSATNCAPKCGLLVPSNCAMPCSPACDCLPGFVFKAGQSGDCIRPSECAIQSREDQEKCGPNAGFSQHLHVAAGCAPNCEHPTNGPSNCPPDDSPMIDGPGCRCLRGFIYREGQSGLCILPEKCPKKENSTLVQTGHL